ncbi:MAG: glutamate formimidoyltransferase [Bacteroidota bacterium]|nr:glutamate formimidoyltransferase [Bacteroidota bacterium]
MEQALIECVPNFSEGRDQAVIEKILQAITAVEGVTMLNSDPGKATNRTVVTFAGVPEAVIEGAYRGIKTATELIDMRKHKGEHPRMGATDVCPLIPLANITLKETAEYAKKLAKRVGEELNIPVYLYEAAASSEARRNLAVIREGEYEGLEKKMQRPEWKPDFGPGDFNPRSGATVIGARDFLIAYNINLNTNSSRIANAIAFDVREQGRVKRKGHPLLGEIERDEHGEAVRIPGTLKSVKAIGWYIEEYGIAQISMNLTNINMCSLHKAFDEVVGKAHERGVRVTGSEIVGMVPRKVLLEAGSHFIKKQDRSLGVPEEEILAVAIRTLGLNDVAVFDPKEKIIEFKLQNDDAYPLNQLTIRQFADKTGSESPAPGGGSISAYVGALGAGLGMMVANLSANKRGWEDRVSEFSHWAESGQEIKESLLKLVDEDTHAFNKVMDALGMAKETGEEKKRRSEAIEKANLGAANVPLQVMRKAMGTFPLLREMAEKGNPNSVSDAAVGALCARTAIEGAYYNVRINVGGIKNEQAKTDLMTEAENILKQAREAEKQVLALVDDKM